MYWRAKSFTPWCHNSLNEIRWNRKVCENIVGMPTSPEGSSRPQLPLQGTSRGGRGGESLPSDGVTFAAATAPSVTPQLVSELRDDANRKVRERETYLKCFRDLLFPPESTNSPEAGESSSTIILPGDNDPRGSLPTSLLSPARAIQGPGMREVQASIRSLREASLLVVEAVCAWREAKRTEVRETSQSGCGGNVPTATFQDVGSSESFWSKPQVPASTGPTGGGSLRTASREVRFPDVPLAQVASTASKLGRDTTNREDPPIFFWFPPTSGLPPEGSKNHRRAQYSRTSGPEGVDCDLGGDAAATAATVATGHTNEGGEGRVTVTPSTLEPNDENGGGGGGGGGGDAQIPTVVGVNYLARMASDTDFAGQPGSALMDFFPPDAKLYRNPFILGHNLDDTLKIISFPDDGGGASSGAGGGLGAGQSRSAAIRGMDTRRVGLAAAVIVAEDAREREEENCTAAFSDAGVGENKGVGSGDARALSGAETGMERGDEGRRLGGAPGSRSSVDDGPKRKSTGRSAEDGIRFEDGGNDLQVTDGGSQGGKDFPSIRKTERGAHHPGRLKRSRKAHTTASLVVTDASGDIHKTSRLDERVGAGARDVPEGKGFHHYRSRHELHNSQEEGGWVKATKERTYTGPWVPVLLDTNVSCPEGINEALAEDDVSWQITKGDRIRIGSCTGHEWKVDGVIIVPNGKGKCRVILSEPYKHAKATGTTPRSRLQRVLNSQQLHQAPHNPGLGSSLPQTAGATVRGEGGGSERADGRGIVGGVAGGEGARLAKAGERRQVLTRDRNGLRTAPSQGNRGATTGGSGTAAASHSRRLSSSSASLFPSLQRANKNVPGSPQTEALAASSSLSWSARANPVEEPSKARPATPLLAADSGSSRPPTTMAAVVTSASSAGKRKHTGDGKSRRRGAGSALAGFGKSGRSFYGKQGAGAKRKVEVEETPEQHAAKNLAIFENNLAGLSLPGDAAGKGSAGGRRRSLLGGYKAHAEAVHESRQNFSLGDKSAAGKSNREYHSPLRRFSGIEIESERMPGAERPGGKKSENHGTRGGAGGLAKCQRVWKMVPQSRDNRPTWLRQYEEGSIEYGSHYQGSVGRNKKETHFRVQLSWALLEIIVKDRPHTRRFADLRPKQRFTFFRKLGLHDLLAIAYEKASASSGGTAGPEKTPAGGMGGGGGQHQGPELDIKSWHKFVVSLGYISDVSQPARHHDIDQMYRQRTIQYKVELSRMETQAAKERERLQAEEKAHARRMAAAGEAGKDDQNVQTPGRPESRGTRPGSTRPTASGKRPGPTAPPSVGNGSRPTSKGRREGAGVEQQRCKTAGSGTSGARERAKVGAGDQRRKTDTTADLQGHGLGAGLPGSGGATDSVRGHQQVVMKHVLDQDLRMDLAGFKDALRALACFKHPEEEHKNVDEPLRDLFFNYILISPELEGVREMAWLEAKKSAIRAEAPLQCAAVRIQAVWRGTRRLRIYRRQGAACLLIHTWIRMVVKRSRYRAELRRLEALRIAALRRASSTTIQRWFRRTSWLWRFQIACETRLKENLRRWREWRAAKRRKRRRKEEAVVFRQSRNLNGCMVLVSMSRKKPRGLDMHVRAYVPATQETFRFVIGEKALCAQICRALKTESLSGTEVLENLELVAARLSCRKQRDGHRWVVSRAKRVAAEAGSLVFRVARRLDGIIYFCKVYRSPTDVAVTAYEPKRCETIRTALPIRGTRGVSAWIKWEVEVGTARRRRELSRRLREAQKILKLHEMNVEVPRPALLAARRLESAIERRHAILSVVTKETNATVNANATTALSVADRSDSFLLLGDDSAVGRQWRASKPPAFEKENQGSLSKMLAVGGDSSITRAKPPAATTTEAESTAVDPPPLDAELTGMGPLPFVWYEGSVQDLAVFGEVPLESDEVASAPDIDITARGQETMLARWILHRVKVERVRVVQPSLPGDGVGGKGVSGTAPRAPKMVASWKTVLMTLFEVETRKRDVAASRIQGLSYMRRARDRSRALVLAQFEKRFDIYSGTFYYHSNRSGVDTFVKPRVLRADQDIEEPADEWIERKDRSGKSFYTNPATGQTSWLSVPEAATVIVKACRHFLRTLYGIPRHEEIERGLRFSREAEEAWAQGGGRLASTLNYALVLHTHRHDLDAAGALYDTALKLSGENPLVQRTCGLFLLASCRFPREDSRRKALALLSAADYRDRDLDTFALAEGAFYHFGLLSRPTHSRALLNWALVLEHVRRDPDRAEFFYRRALAVNDLDPLVLANFRSFCLERIPGGAYPGGGPGSKVLRRSRLEDQSVDQDGWKRYRDPEAGDTRLATFWFHPLLQEISWGGQQLEEATVNDKTA